MSTINRLAAPDVKKGALYRDHQLGIQNALRHFGISSVVEHPVMRDKLGCHTHPGFEFSSSQEAEDHVKNNCDLYMKFYSLDNYVKEINLDIESDGKIHRKKQLSRDEKRDAYLESLGIHVLRFPNSTPAIAIAQAVSLMKMYKEGREK